MNYANITQEILDYVINDESYEDTFPTLKAALDDLGEDIVFAEWDFFDHLLPERHVRTFTAWSDKNVIYLEWGMGSRFLCRVSRNPPEEEK